MGNKTQNQSESGSSQDRVRIESGSGLIESRESVAATAAKHADPVTAADTMRWRDLVSKSERDRFPRLAQIP